MPRKGRRGASSASSPSMAGEYVKSRALGTVHVQPPIKRLGGWDGSTVATFPFIDPLLTARADVISLEFSQFVFGPFQNGAGGQDWPVNLLATVDDPIYQFVLNKMSAADRNLALLTLTTPTDIRIYINNWAGAYGAYRGLQALMNSQGYNNTFNKIAPVVGSFRGRIQAGLTMLNRIPIPPGLPGLLDQFFGVFSSSEDSVCIVSLGNVQVTNNVPQDYTVATNISNILANAEANLAFFTTAGNETQTVETLFANAYGEPSEEWPAYGVRINPTIVNRFRTMGVNNAIGATNAFALPANFNNGIKQAAIPVLAPRDTQDPLLLSLWRPQVVWAGSDAAKVNQAVAGFCSHLPTNSTNFAYYDKSTSTYHAAGVSATFNGYAQAGEFFWWGPQVANSEVDPYGTDQRSYEDFDIYYVGLEYMTEQTVDLTYKMFLENYRPTTMLPADKSSGGVVQLKSPPYGPSGVAR